MQGEAVADVQISSSPPKGKSSLNVSSFCVYNYFVDFIAQGVDFRNAREYNNRNILNGVFFNQQCVWSVSIETRFIFIYFFDIITYLTFRGACCCG